ncbi:MAG TPA: hypothetical protein VG889_03200 [Rhizomicrobium sp.]|nr:hypothetical protein [Rhizomicrobium sp.]
MRPMPTMLLVLATAPVEAAPTATTFDVPGSKSTTVGAVSKSGIVAGTYKPASHDPCGKVCGFLRMPDATFTTFTIFRAVDAGINAINDDGTAVGFYRTGPWDQGFIRTPDGAIAKIKNGDLFTTAVDVNDSGIALGETTVDSSFRGILRTPDGRLSRFKVKRCQHTIPSGIDATDTVIGTCLRNSAEHGFLRQADGTTTLFDPPGTDLSYGQAIDDSGAIAGLYFDAGNNLDAYLRDADGTFHLFSVASQPQAIGVSAMANVGGEMQVVGNVEVQDRSLGFVYRSGTVETFDIAGGTTGGAGTTVAGIAASGTIAGSYSEDGKVWHGYIRTP